MTVSIQELQPQSPAFPQELLQIDQPPSQLFIRSNNWADIMQRPRVAIVGSRKVTTYGREVTRQLASDLARAGVVVVSGLAIGVDSIAHRAALEAGGLTLAVLPGGLNQIYPSSHTQLAEHMLAQGGALVSEYAPDIHPQKWFFVERNRLVSGLSHALLVTEAAEKSGTLHTANFALDQGREVLAVPGNITGPLSRGTNNLIKTGATPVTRVQDILNILGIAGSQTVKPHSSNPHEQQIIDLIYEGEREGAQLLQQSGLSVSQFNQVLTMLEIQGVVQALGANQWQLKN
ncbi:MAG TPA: DNA-processing protein DprA [Candidatus Saccharimonadales bacterium]|nr:DNA-processing protein DprA [Candidatus Saccharimonadales bacterium]